MKVIDEIVGGVVAKHVILVKAEHILNALFPILVTLFGILILLKFSQYWNAAPPILVTL